MERKLLVKNFRKFGYTSRGCPLFWKFWKMLLHSLLEVGEFLKRTFCLNGKRPWYAPTGYEEFAGDWSQSETSKYFE